MAMAQEQQRLPHRITLDEREKLNLMGATEILHFDEEMTRIQTSRGEVSVFGSQLKLKTLSLDGGNVSVTGQIDAVVYEQPRQKKGWARVWG